LALHKSLTYLLNITCNDVGVTLTRRRSGRLMRRNLDHPSVTRLAQLINQPLNMALLYLRYNRWPKLTARMWVII